MKENTMNTYTSLTINGKWYDIFSPDADTTIIKAQQGKTHANTLKAVANRLRIDTLSIDATTGTITTRDDRAAMMVEAFQTRV